MNNIFFLLDDMTDVLEECSSDLIESEEVLADPVDFGAVLLTLFNVESFSTSLEPLEVLFFLVVDPVVWVSFALELLEVLVVVTEVLTVELSSDLRQLWTSFGSSSLLLAEDMLDEVTVELASFAEVLVDSSSILSFVSSCQCRNSSAMEKYSK